MKLLRIFCFQFSINIFIYLILVLLISIIFLYYFKNTKNKKQIEAVSLARTEIKTNNPDDQIQNILDNRNKSKDDIANKDFILFMHDFHYKKKHNDWKGMFKLVSNEQDLDFYFDMLILYALCSSLSGVKDYDIPWNPQESLDAYGYVELAIILLGAIQNKKDTKEVTLTVIQRKKILCGQVCQEN